MKEAAIKRFKKMVFMVVYFAVSGGLFWTVPSAFSDVGSDVLHRALIDNLEAEAVLQGEIRAAYRLISQPHSEYLLYQKSLGLEEKNADLRQLKFEREALIQKLDSISASQSLPMQIRSSAAPLSPDFVFATYSGAPMLSFNDGSRHSTRVISARAGFYRFLTGAFLVVAFSLPLLALYKKKTEVSPEKKWVRVFPIFARREKNGERAVFQVRVNRHEPLRPKFGGL